MQYADAAEEQMWADLEALQNKGAPWRVEPKSPFYWLRLEHLPPHMLITTEGDGKWSEAHTSLIVGCLERYIQQRGLLWPYWGKLQALQPRSNKPPYWPERLPLLEEVVQAALEVL